MHQALLVGAGGMGRAWARNLNESGISIAAWVDIRTGAAAESASELGIEVGRTDLNLTESLSLPTVSFVVDVTVPEAHCAVTVEALRAGKHVIGEKPMAASLDEAREMISAADAANRIYMVSQSRRYNAGMKAYRDLIASRLGGVGILTADFFQAPRFGGFRDAMPSPLVVDMAIHTFDQARYLTGTDPVAVYAEEFNPGWSWYEGDAAATACFEMTNGLRFQYRGCWCADGLGTSWDCGWRAVGPNGTALWDGHGDPIAELGRNACECVVQPRESIDEGIRGSLREFLGAMESGATPNGECHDNIKSLAMVMAAVESAKSGKRVAVTF